MDLYYMDDPVTPTSYLADEINEINDSCKWSFTVPNFYVKFSTLLPPPARSAKHPCTYTRLAFSLEKKSHFSWIQRGKSVLNRHFPLPV